MHPSKNCIEKQDEQKGNSNKRIPSFTAQKSGMLEEERGKVPVEHLHSDDNVLSEEGQKRLENQQNE